MVLAEKLGRGVRPASQNPYPIYDQNLRFSRPYPGLKQIKSTDTRGGAPQGILGGGVPPRSPNPDPISDQKM